MYLVIFDAFWTCCAIQVYAASLHITVFSLDFTLEGIVVMHTTSQMQRHAHKRPDHSSILRHDKMLFNSML